MPVETELPIRSSPDCGGTGEGEPVSPPEMLLAQAAAGAASMTDGKYVSVRAEGTGATKIDALNAAWIEAVRSAIGMYLSASTEVLNDDVFEKVVAYSRGRLNSYRELSSFKGGDGVWHVTIVAEIERDVLEETAASAATATVAVDDQLRASAATEADRRKSARELISEFNDSYKPEDLIVTRIGRPEVRADGGVYVSVHLDFNDKKYRQVYLNGLVRLLEQLSVHKGELGIKLLNLT
jgi:hypothetical protein